MSDLKSVGIKCEKLKMGFATLIFDKCPDFSYTPTVWRELTTFWGTLQMRIHPTLETNKQTNVTSIFTYSNSNFSLLIFIILLSFAK